MIGYLNGTVTTIGDSYVIIDVNGVGYRVVLPEKWHVSISKTGDNIKAYTHFVLNPRDGTVTLFGFQSPEELKFFELLTTVSGVGPKSAQSILSKADLQTIQVGIMKEDAKYLSQTTGIGNKMAQKLIIELKTKIMKTDISVAQDSVDMTSEMEALDALRSLGYSQYQAVDALKQVDKSINTVEEKITEALKIVGKK